MSTPATTPVRFGLGLISIGRTWGFRPRPLPAPEQVHAFLAAAVKLGVTLFDTAPSYGSSEETAGAFFRGLSPEARGALTVATKFGENWDSVQQEAWPDHTYDGLRRSLDLSLNRLGRIDVLQLHKTTPEILRSTDFRKAVEYARACGIPLLGASVKDVESGRIACGMDALGMIQMPYNLRNRVLEQLFDVARWHGKRIWTNRPFGMGQVLHEDPVEPAVAYGFVLQRNFEGAILTGTADLDHLREDLNAFRQACGDPWHS